MPNRTYTDTEIEAGIHTALKRHDVEVIRGLIGLLAL